MNLIFDNDDEEEDDESEVEEPDFESMDSEEFFDDLVRDAAESMDVTVAELEEMHLSEIDEQLGAKIEKPYHPRGAREGYRSSDRLETVSKEELERRKKVVEEKLEI